MVVFIQEQHRISLSSIFFHSKRRQHLGCFINFRHSSPSILWQFSAERFFAAHEITCHEIPPGFLACRSSSASFLFPFRLDIKQVVIFITYKINKFFRSILLIFMILVQLDVLCISNASMNENSLHDYLLGILFIKYQYYSTYCLYYLFIILLCYVRSLQEMLQVLGAFGLSAVETD